MHHPQKRCCRPYAALWRSIYLAGLTLNPCHQYSIGQFDYTPASGWLYSIGGGTNYPLKYLSDYELRDGDVLVLRYTLAGGRDVGDAGAAGSKDTAAGNAFCVTAINGSLTVAHQWTTVVNEDGTEQKVCAPRPRFSKRVLVQAYFHSAASMRARMLALSA